MRIKRFAVILLLVMVLGIIGASPAQAAEEIPDVTQYSYTVKPLLDPFYYCIYVQTDNPDPTSFRLVDRDSIYYQKGDKGSIEIPLSSSMASVADADPGTYYIIQNIFPDVVYEDESTYRVPGGYIFHCRQAYSDGGEFVLLQKTHSGSDILGDRFETTDVTIPCPQMKSRADYLIETYTTEDMSFFEKLDAVQSGLSSVGVYPRDVMDINKPSSYPYPLLAASYYPENVGLNDHYLMYGELIYGLLSSYAYPFVVDSLGFPGTMSAVAKQLEPECTVESTSVHYMIKVTFDGETKSYGGQGAGGNDPLYTNRVEKDFTFQGENDLGLNGTVERFCEILRGYGPIATADAAAYRDLIEGDTFKSTIKATGGTWLRIGVEGFGLGISFGYAVPEGNSVRIASNTWVDGRYVSNKETVVMHAKFEDYPNANIVLHDVTFMDYSGNVYTQDLYYRYDAATDTWISSYYAVSDLSTSQREKLTLTRAEVEALNVDGRSAFWPEDALVYDGSEYPGTPFHHVSVTGVEVQETQEMDVGETAVLTFTVFPEDASDNRVIWTSSDPSIVEVRNPQEGTVLARNKGTVTLTASTIDGDLKDICTVTVLDPCPKYGHSFTDYTPNGDATCTENETQTAKCDYCDATDTIRIPDSTLSHSVAQWTVTREKTCLEDGELSGLCSVCGETVARKILAQGHSFTVTEKPAACTEDRYTTYTCVCGHSYNVMTDAAGHLFSDGVCARCGIEMDESQAEPGVLETEATIYYLPSWAEGILELPAEYPTSYQIQVLNAENVSFSVGNNYYITVSKTGLVKPAEMYSGTGHVYITADDKSLQVRVKVVNYAELYANQIIDEYLAENYSENMSIREKLDMICRFVVQYEFVDSRRETAQYLLQNGGSSYSSSNLVVLMCGKIGISAHTVTRDGDNILSSTTHARTGLYDGLYYDIWTHYEGETPRKYAITAKSGPYTYEYVKGGIELTHYLGTVPEILEIPEVIDGYRVVGVDEDFLAYNRTVKKIVLPDTLRYLKNRAFADMYALEEINIPALLTDIGKYPFLRTGTIQKLTVDSGNPSYYGENNMLFTKDRSTLLFCALCDDPQLPDTTETVGSYAFCNNSALKRIILPKSVTALEGYAFSACVNLEWVELTNTSSVGYGAFQGCTNLTWIYVPDAVTSIGDYAFGYNIKGEKITEEFVISGYAGSAAEQYAVENGFRFVDAAGSQWVTTSAGTRYFLYGIPVVGNYTIDGEEYWFDRQGYLCAHPTTELLNVVEPGCIKGGYSGDTHCAGCGMFISEGVYLEKLDHHVFEDYTSNGDATCTKNGTKTGKCRFCGTDDTVTDPGTVLGHDCDAWTVITAVSCTEPGLRTRTCARCGFVEKWETPAAGHKYSPVETKPTCTEAGYTTYTCSACGDRYTDNETAAYGHSYSGGKCAVCGIEMDASQAEPSVWPRSAEIYLLEDWAEGILEIPAEYFQSHQIKVENAGDVSFRVYSGSSVTVSEDGLVVPRVTATYWYGSTGYPYQLSGKEYDRITYKKNFGESVIRVTADGKTFDITVNVCGYGEAYTDKVMEDYLAENYSEDMTIAEKMDVICRFPTQYAYDSSCYDGAQMIATGAGNYYASAEAIVMLCEKVGFEAKIRDAYYDSGTHSSDNVIVTVGAEDYYILDAGFSGEVPRKYLVTHRTSPYVYKQVEGGIEICQFDGTTTETFEVPARIDGYRVVGLGSSLFRYDSVMKKVILPDTLQYIKESAFYNADLEEIHIPENVISIGTRTFSDCDYLTKLTVDENNPAYTARNGVIYTKDETTLVSAHLSAEPLLPDTLKTVGDYAFYYNTAVTQVTLLGSVESVGKYAFSDCDNLTLVDLGNVKTIGDYAMVYCPKLTWVYVPETVETIGNKALGYRYYSTLTDGFVISGHKGTAAETYAAENGITFVDADVPQWVETTVGKRYFVNGIPVTGSYEIDGETYYFTDDGFLCVHKTTELKGKMPATCAVEGYTGDTVCKTCGCVVTQGTAIEKLAHFFGSWVTNTSATCEEKGQQRRDCFNCDAFETRETDPLGHTYKNTVTRPTCTEKGYTTHTCSRCKDSYVDTYVDELGHSFTRYISDGNATCTEDGTKTAKCNRCDVTDTVADTGSAKGHSYGTWTETKAAACTTKGEERRDCSECDTFETRETNALGHDYKAVVTTPTCTEQGYTTHTCSRCKDSYVDTYVDELGHSFTYYVSDGNATCTEDGTKTAKCDRCDVTDTMTDTGSAKGHSYGTWTETKAAACTTKGEERRDCSECDTFETRETNALGHDYKAVVTAPTCSEQGYTTHTCSRCDDSYVDTYVDELGHSFTRYISDGNATCTEDGTKTTKCDRCDVTDTMTDIGSAKGHSYGTWTTTKAATCTAKGEERRECSNCDAFETRETDALGHDYKAVVTAPTCSEQGYTTHTCSRCDDSYVDTYVDALGHGYKAVETAPICTEQGYTTHTCSRCKDSYVDTYVDALDHSFTKYVSDGNATCTEDGTKTAKCDRCDVTDTMADTGSAKGHSYGTWTTTKAASCTAKGEERRECSNGDAFETRETDALGHDYKAVVTAPTCTEQGYTTHTCSRCKDSYVDTYVDELGHSFTYYVSDGNATCTEDGTKTAKCDRCDVTDTMTDIGSAKGHSYGTWTTTKAATCTAKGEERRECSNCDAFETRETDALGHDYKAVVTAPTCSEQGYTTHTCSRCDDSYVDTYVDALGHGYKAVETAPTCTEQGYTTHTCSRCKDSYVDTYVDALDHSFTKYVSDGNATCTADGTKTAKCDRCDVTDTMTDIGSANGHSYGEWIVTKAPTMAESGEEMRVCALCGAEETRSIDKRANPFVDVASGAYYETPVLWAVEMGVTNGTDETHFTPNRLCTRAEVVTFLWRAVGSPEPIATTHPFVDVRAGSYYEKAVLWAVENEITMGMDDTHFGPTLECTRAQVAMFLWRALGEPDVESSENPFKDVSANRWFYEPVLWAAEAGVTTGIDSEHFFPNRTCTRGQIVTFLYRALW